MNIRTSYYRILLLLFLLPTATLMAQENSNDPIIKAEKINATTVCLTRVSHHKTFIDFYGENIFRMFQDNKGGEMRPPQAKPEAQILLSTARHSAGNISIKELTNGTYSIQSSRIAITFDKSGLFTIKDLRSNNVVVSEASPVQYDKSRVILTLKNTPKTYYYGGGVQNGRFSHAGTAINIVNENSWTDGGVSSPDPFYWSTSGYGLMWYTFKPGRYDFGAKDPKNVVLTHETTYLDVFFMVSPTPVSLLQDYYQLTGNPVLLPKFGFYEGHLNAYNRDYWKEDPKGILFEDGKRYVESQKDNGGIKESLNGEKNNYQFSARAVIDRYHAHDMPLGWILPNDGYGAGYGQTATLEGNLQNLKEFGNYARQHGVRLGLWTQSDLHPKPNVKPLLQRDIIKEVGESGVRILKTDVAWVGAGYSFGLNGIEEVAKIMPKEGDDARPFIITLDGWAGTQHYAGVWTGDQTGGKWEYIRFHIPTYIGSGLSGQPNICSDMDGIFGGKNPIINTRDFQWKTYTPMQLNMDGWGANPKYPHIMGEVATSINRMYLKMKSELIPYTYSIAHQAVTGEPIMRAMFLEDPNSYTLGRATQYQYMYGPYLLVAPIYQDTQADKTGNDVRNHIYLPDGKWIDYFTGKVYEGGRIINNISAPIWKLPLFVKAGAILPMTIPNNNMYEIPKDFRSIQVYPYGKSSFNLYDDDGETQAYLNGAYTETTISMKAPTTGKGNVTLHIAPTKGNYKGFVNEKRTEVVFNTTQKPNGVIAIVGGKRIKLSEVSSEEAYLSHDNVYFYEAQPNLNRFATKGSDFEKVRIIKNPELKIRLAKSDVSTTAIEIKVKGFKYDLSDPLLHSQGKLSAPSGFAVSEERCKPYSLTPTWTREANADYYEVKFGERLYSTIREDSIIIDNLRPDTKYTLQLRAINQTGTSAWTTLIAATKSDPLEYAIPGIRGTVSVPIQEGFEAKNLFDRSVGTIMHTKYRNKAVPFDIVIDLTSFNTLDKMDYLPRTDAGNGTILTGTIYTSMDKKDWEKAGDFSWQRTGQTKTYTFAQHPVARFVKLHVTSAVGNYGSGREIYVYKVPGTESLIPGDINHDGKIDNNDYTSYINYTGLRKGDADFDGYVSRGDVNRNGWIDAYDISNVATLIDGGVSDEEAPIVGGSLSMASDKMTYQKGDTINLTISGKDLQSVNALSLVLPYDAKSYEYLGIKPLNMGHMDDLSKDRTHANGDHVLYPTFVNVGKESYLSGSKPLCIIQFRAKQALTCNLKMHDPILVDVNLNEE